MGKRIHWNERRLALKRDLDERRLPCAVGIIDSKHVENIGGIVRTMNAFLGSEVVIDAATYNKYAAAGADKWEQVVKTTDVLGYLRAAGYSLVALEQHERSLKLWDFDFPERCALIIGHEVQGMADETVELCDHVVEIPQYGLVESLNVATATSIALYEYSRQHRGGHRS